MNQAFAKQRKSARRLESECAQHFGEPAARLLGDMSRKIGLGVVVRQDEEEVTVAGGCGARIEMAKTPEGICYRLCSIPRPAQHALKDMLEEGSLAERFGEDRANHPQIEYVKGSVRNVLRNQKKRLWQVSLP